MFKIVDLHLILLSVFINFLLRPPLISAQQCPTVGFPCSCTPSRDSQSIEIFCDRADSLATALASLGDVKGLRIQSLVLTNTPIRVLPDHAFQGFLVSRLVLNHNGMVQVDDSAFDGLLLDHLTELDLRNNQLGQLFLLPNSGGLKKLKRLRTLILAKNQLTNLPSRPFGRFESRDFLQKIDLSGNQLTRIDQNTFDDLPNLEELSLEANRLTNLAVPQFRNMRRLKNLNLGLNRISHVPNNALDFPNLESLSLEFNQISSLQAEALKPVSKLTYLSLTGNKFTTWDPETFRYVGSLRILGMGETPITRIPNNAFHYIRNLVRLEMTESAVDTVEQGAFQRINNVETLVMNKNRLKKVNASMFQTLMRLESLDLSGNQLSLIDDRSWANLPALKHLDISSNDLSQLAPSTFANTFMPSSKTRVLYSCDNPWNCDQSLQWFRQWLRDNPDIVIDKPPGCLAACKRPTDLDNWPLRQENPYFTSPTALPWTEQPLNDYVSPHNLGWIILAIILAILLCSILLLAITRYFVSQKRKREKEEEEARMLSSANSMVQPGSVVGSAYPASAIDLNLPPATSLYDREHYWQTY